MTKRFTITSELPKGWVDIIDTDNNQTLCNIRIEYANNMITLLNKLYKENEQLKKENMEYHHLVSCDNCKYHNYDWFDDGDEFEVCDKGNTERLMYNKFCKEWREFE